MSTLKKPWQKEVPKEHEARLAEFSPQTEHFTWLKLIWEAGYPWEIVERYMIYQMVPRRAVIPEILEQLEHPLPPSKMGNYYDTVLQEFVRNEDCLITERAYWLFRETGCWGRPYWVIQGKKGGHKRWYSPTEKKFLKLAGLPHEPPAPGDLPYAEFSDLTLEALKRQDALKGVQGSLKRLKKALGNEQYSKRYEAENQEFRRQITAAIYDQVDEIAEDVRKSLMKLDAPRNKFDPKKLEALQERAEQAFIETGSTKGNLIKLA